jgi:ATP-dependent DNA ligase
VARVIGADNLSRTASLEVKLELVAQIRFVQWTAEGRLRHAAFLGLRSDKAAHEVRRE